MLRHGGAQERVSAELDAEAAARAMKRTSTNRAASCAVSTGCLAYTRRDGRRVTGDMHERPKCTTQSASACSAATSSIQQLRAQESARRPAAARPRAPCLPNVVSASRKTLTAGPQAACSAFVQDTASAMNSSGNCSATRRKPRSATQAATSATAAWSIAESLRVHAAAGARVAKVSELSVRRATNRMGAGRCGWPASCQTARRATWTLYSSTRCA